MPLHYTKSGALDMRYSSSKAAVASGSGGGGIGSRISSGSGYSSYSSGAGGGLSYSYGGLHYKKDGTPDMRYSSSKAAVNSYGRSSSPGYGTLSSGLHYKKDGTPDMRYSSSKQAATSSTSGFFGTSHLTSSDLHYKKDGSLDMRYSTSKQMANDFSNMKLTTTSNTLGRQLAGERRFPSFVPLTKTGLPDMRCKKAKDYVRQQIETYSHQNALPPWLPRKKDGSLDTSKKVVQEFLPLSYGVNDFSPPDHDQRDVYYRNKITDCDDFRQCVQQARRDIVLTPDLIVLPETAKLRDQFKSTHLRTSNRSSTLSTGQEADLGSMVHAEIPSSVPEISYTILKASFPDEEKATLGSGTFGIVFKGSYNGQTVAVKRLHLGQLNKKDKQSFVTEMKILALIGDHPNLVKLYGYCLSPPAFVMEFVKIGSLSQLLHYCEDNAVEAKMTDGRVKHCLLLGIVAGMQQIHAVGVVHGDLKTANILVTEKYEAKVTDFGLASLRGKTSSSVVSSAATSSTDDGENIIGGTGGYMAPELLDSSNAPEYSSDVYSFGILLNEVVQEEEPYSGEEVKFHGRGPFGAANYARLGNRPFIKSGTPADLRKMIEACWSPNKYSRPTFEVIAKKIASIKIPNSF